MKILQTLGRSNRNGDNQEGVFAYRRDDEGVFIDGSIGQAESLEPRSIRLTADEWNNILKKISELDRETFRLSKSGETGEPNIYEILENAIPNPTFGWHWNGSWASYVAAILEHEGSIDLYSGPRGHFAAAFICLSRHTSD